MKRITDDELDSLERAATPAFRGVIQQLRTRVRELGRVVEAERKVTRARHNELLALREAVGDYSQECRKASCCISASPKERNEGPKAAARRRMFNVLTEGGGEQYTPEKIKAGSTDSGLTVDEVFEQVPTNRPVLSIHLMERWEATCPTCGKLTERHSTDGTLTSIFRGKCGHTWEVSPSGKKALIEGGGDDKKPEVSG